MSVRFRVSRIRRQTLKAGGAIVACTVLGACAGGESQPVYIGVAGPLGLSYGTAMTRGAELAAERINAAGGIDGRRLELVVVDDSALATRAIEVAAELRADPRILAVVGHITSGATLAAAEIYNDPEQGVVAVSPSASSPLVTGSGPWLFRICPSDLKHGPALARWVTEELGRQRASVIYANDGYGRGLMRSFVAAFRNNGTILSRDPYLPSLIDSADALDPYLRRGIRNGMDVLMIAGLVDEGATILHAARRLGYTGTVIGADGLIGIETAGPDAAGVFVSSPFLPGAGSSRTRDFIQTYRDQYQTTPDAYAALTYDAVLLVANAITQVLRDFAANAEPTVDQTQKLRTAIRDHLASVGQENPAFRGVTGTIAFDENGDVPDKRVVIGVARDGELVPVGRNMTIGAEE